MSDPEDDTASFYDGVMTILLILEDMSALSRSPESIIEELIERLEGE